MKRRIITNNGQGIYISDGEIWMTTWELADLFYTTAGANNAAIIRILKSIVFKIYEVCKFIKLEIGYSADVYNLDMVIALSYQIDTGHSTAFRKWVTSKVQFSRGNNISFFVHLGDMFNC